MNLEDKFNSQFSPAGKVLESPARLHTLQGGRKSSYYVYLCHPCWKNLYVKMGHISIFVPFRLSYNQPLSNCMTISSTKLNVFKKILKLFIFFNLYWFLQACYRIKMLTRRWCDNQRSPSITQRRNLVS